MAVKNIIKSNTLAETIQQISTLPPDQVEKNILKQLIIIADALTTKSRFVPEGYSYTTSKVANTPTELVSSELIASNFVVYNGGGSATGDLLIGTSTVRPISISPGGNLLFNYGIVGQETDLSQWYVSCSTSSQPYSILILADA